MQLSATVLGHACTNLKDNGYDVIVGVLGNINKAKDDGLKVFPVAEAAKQTEVIMIYYLMKFKVESMRKKSH